jgi:penicillin amidase
VLRRKGLSDVVVGFHENEHGVLDGDPREAGLRLAYRWSVAADTGAASLSGGLADRHGNVGFQMSGLMPRRGNGQRAFVPLPGWDPANDRCGFVPAADLPNELNPPSGFVASANDALNLDGARVHPVNLPLAHYRAGGRPLRPSLLTLVPARHRRLGRRPLQTRRVSAAEWN